MSCIRPLIPRVPPHSFCASGILTLCRLSVHTQKAAPTETSQPSEAGSKPWMALVFTLLLLFASLGGNVYLLWIAGDLRRRYRDLLTAGGGGTL